jgi:hypothetical protein
MASKRREHGDKGTGSKSGEYKAPVRTDPPVVTPRLTALIQRADGRYIEVLVRDLERMPPASLAALERVLEALEGTPSPREAEDVLFVAYALWRAAHGERR